LRSEVAKAALQVCERERELARVEQAKVLSGIHPAQITAAERERAVTHEQLAQAQRELARRRGLFAGAVVGEAELDRFQSDVVRAKAALAADESRLQALREFVRPEDVSMAAARLDLAEAHVRQAREEYEKNSLIAPIDGTVLRILKREGDVVRRIDAEPVMLFGDLSRMRVRAEIDERNVGPLRPGQSVSVWARGLGGRRYQGQIAAIRSVMGRKAVFSKESTERRDIDVVEILIDMEEAFRAPVGMRVDVSAAVGS
jgi:multidrug resistance efflux pump